MEVKVIGGIGETNFGKQYRQGNRVYDTTQISPAMMAKSVGNQGGQSPLIIEVTNATTSNSKKNESGQ